MNNYALLYIRYKSWFTACFVPMYVTLYYYDDNDVDTEQ